MDSLQLHLTKSCHRHRRCQQHLPLLACGHKRLQGIELNPVPAEGGLEMAGSALDDQLLESLGW